MTPRIIQDSDDINDNIRESLRGYRARMEKDWEDMFPKDFPSKRIREKQKDAVPGAKDDGCGDGCGAKDDAKDGDDK